MTYDKFISQFEILENPPKKKGFQRHHIVPKSEQTEPDERQVYLTLPQHMWAHILYDREHRTKTSSRFLSNCGKSMDYFDCFERCLEMEDILQNNLYERARKIREWWTDERRESLSAYMKEYRSSPEMKQKISMASKKMWESEEYRANISKKRMEYWSDENNRADASERAKEIFSRPEVKEAIREGCLSYWSKEENKQKASEHFSQLSWWNNGKENKRSKEQPGPEWTKGRLMTFDPSFTSGMHWWNDGHKNHMSIDCPGEGWVRGKLMKKEVS